MTNEIIISGVGITCAIGNNISEVYQALQSKESGIQIHSIKLKEQTLKFPLGLVKFSNSELEDELKIKSQTIHSRTALLGLYAARQAITNCSIPNRDQLKGGIISATSVGGMDHTEKLFPELEEGDFSKSAQLISHDSGYATQCIADDLQISNFVTTISTACSSSANAIMLGAKLLQNKTIDYALVGGTDAITQFTIQGFNSLLILDQSQCRPFDQNRAGLNLGEGAAYLVLQRKEDVKKEDIIANLKGFANNNDAFHQTASSDAGNGATLAMQNALLNAGLEANQIDYVNAHGTGTKNNDSSETNALSRVFGNKSVLNYSSTKGFSGHTLAAAGAIEAIISILALKHQFMPINLGLDNPIETDGITPLKDTLHQPITNVLSNSFGFGGNCSTLIFSI